MVQETATEQALNKLANDTLAAYEAHAASYEESLGIANGQSDSLAAASGAAVAAFQWPWNIAKKGAEHLGNHGSAVAGLVDGGKAVATSPQGAAIVTGIKSNPKDAANTDKVLNDGIFSPALNSVKADNLLRTIFIGFGGGGQVGFAGGSGGAGVAYDVVQPSDRAAVTYSEFDLGIGAKVSAGLLVGAMSRQPSKLNDSTNLWSNGISIGIGVYLQVIMRSSDLSLIGFVLNIGAGGGASSSAGYGSISA